MGYGLHLGILTRAVVQQGMGGGMELHAEALRRGLAERGHQVTTITTPHPQGVRQQRDDWGATYFVGNDAPGAYRRSWWNASLETLLQLHHQTPFDVIVGHGKAAYAYLGARQRLPNSQRAPVAVITHNTIISELKAQLAQLHRRPQTVARWLPRGITYFADDLRRLRLAEAITAITEDSASTLRRWFALDASRVHVIFNGIDIAALDAGQKLRRPIRQQLGIPDEVCVVMMLARLVRNKGQHYLLDALTQAELCALSRPFHVVLVGDGPARASLEEQAHRLGIQQHITFAGHIAHEDIPGFLAAADIVTLPTASDGMPLSLLEAMACARPVVASNIRSIASFLETGRTGYLVPIAQPAALAHALAELIASPAHAGELGKRASDVVRARFDQRRMVEGYEQVFLQIATSASAAATSSEQSNR